MAGFLGFLRLLRSFCPCRIRLVTGTLCILTLLLQTFLLRQLGLLPGFLFLSPVLLLRDAGRLFRLFPNTLLLFPAPAFQFQCLLSLPFLLLFPSLFLGLFGLKDAALDEGAFLPGFHVHRTRSAGTGSLAYLVGGLAFQRDPGAAGLLACRLALEELQKANLLAVLKKVFSGLPRNSGLSQLFQQFVDRDTDLRGETADGYF